MCKITISVLSSDEVTIVRTATPEDASAVVDGVDLAKCAAEPDWHDVLAELQAVEGDMVRLAKWHEMGEYGCSRCRAIDRIREAMHYVANVIGEDVAFPTHGQVETQFHGPNWKDRWAAKQKGG